MKPILRPIACITSTGIGRARLPPFSSLAFCTMCIQYFATAAVAGRVIDQLELAVADVVVDRLRHADARPDPARARGPAAAILLAVSIESLPPM